MPPSISEVVSHRGNLVGSGATIVVHCIRPRAQPCLAATRASTLVLMLPRISKPPADSANSLPPPDLVGRELGSRYRIDARLGAGGFGVVYRAWDKQEDRPVALKALREELVAHKSLRKRFAREAKALAALRHPNIVTITDYGVVDGLPILAMELLQGHALDQELKEQGALTEDRALFVFTELLLGIEYMHEQGLVHRDLKPGNIFIEVKEGKECVKLLDFGLAKFLQGGEGGSEMMTLTNTGEVFGTPGYMPPEQLVSEKADQRADLYSLTVVMFQMLSGRRPFEGEAHDVLRSVLVDLPPTLHERCEQWEAHPALEAWFQKGMAKEPDARFQNVEAMRKELEALPRPMRLAAGDGASARKQESMGSAETMLHKTPANKSQSVVGLITWTRFRGLLSRGVRRLAFASAALISLLSLVLIGVAAVAIYIMSSDAASTSPALKEMISEPPAAPAKVRELKQAPAKPPQEKEVAVANDMAAAPQPKQEVQAKTPATPKPKARDPFRRSTPKSLSSIRKLLLKGSKGNDRMIAVLRRHNRDYPEDSRGHLLLGMLYFNRQWNKDVIAQYEFAFLRDPSARGEPHMLSNLVRLAGDSSTGEEAAALIRQVYGQEAKTTVSRAIKRAADEAEMQRLSQLLATLE